MKKQYMIIIIAMLTLILWGWAYYFTQQKEIKTWVDISNEIIIDKVNELSWNNNESLSWNSESLDRFEKIILTWWQEMYDLNGWWR